MTRMIATFKPHGLLLALMLSVLLVLAVGSLAPSRVSAATDADRAALRAQENAFTSIAEQVEPSVVSIESTRVVKQTQNRDSFEDFFRSWGLPSTPRDKSPKTQQSKSWGSGVIVRSDGYILTNDHVVGGADYVTVILTNGGKYNGKVLRDQYTDLALVKIDAKGLPAAKLGDSDRVKPGQWAIAIGNPLEYSNTLTVGVISAVTREVQIPDADSPDGARIYPDAIQTDASINPGNSGGPLVNIDGEVIGINAAIASMGGGNMGIGFAIPSNTAKYVMDQLVSRGKVTRGKLGLSPEDLTADQAEHYGVTGGGALVESIMKGSAADKAKLQVEDVIVELNGKKIDSAATLRRVAAMTPPDTKTSMVVIRDRKRVTLNVVMGAATTEVAAGPDEVGKDDVGLKVSELTADKAEQLKIDSGIKGVVVDSVKDGSAADRADFRAGDVIRRINGNPVPTVSDFNKVMRTIKPGGTAQVVVQRVVQGTEYSQILTLRKD